MQIELPPEIIAAVCVNGARVTMQVFVGCATPFSTGVTETFVGKLLPELGLNVIELVLEVLPDQPEEE